ncbi:MAG: DedA family protein [Gammaproteobacteria bacterium]
MFNWVTKMVEDGGYVSIALLMLLENVLPPIPSELILPLAGFTAARGEHNIIFVILAATAGSLLGAIFWYYIGKLIGRERLKLWAARHGRWLTMSPRDLDKTADWFERHCEIAVFFGRMIPTIRTLISVPAGIYSMAFIRFLTYSFLGTAIWVGMLVSTGYLLEQGYQRVQTYLNPVSNLVFAIIFIWYVYRVVTFKKRLAHP